MTDTTILVNLPSLSHLENTLIVICILGVLHVILRL